MSTVKYAYLYSSFAVMPSARHTEFEKSYQNFHGIFKLKIRNKATALFWFYKSADLLCKMLYKHHAVVQLLSYNLCQTTYRDAGSSSKTFSLVTAVISFVHINWWTYSRPRCCCVCFSPSGSHEGEVCPTLEPLSSRFLSTRGAPEESWWPST
jgi:hypothetical protein